MERRNPFVHTRGIRFEYLFVLWRKESDRLTGDAMEIEAARELVMRPRGRTKQFGEIPAGKASCEVHLEEPILRVDISGPKGEVGAVLRRDRRNTQVVPLDADRTGNARHMLPAIESRKRAAECKMRDRERQEQERDDRVNRLQAGGLPLKPMAPS